MSHPSSQIRPSHPPERGVFEVPGVVPGGGVLLIAITARGQQVGQRRARTIREYNEGRDELRAYLAEIDPVGPQLVRDAPAGPRPAARAPEAPLSVSLLLWRRHLAPRRTG